CDGAKRSQILFRVTLPLLKPILLYLVVMGTIAAIQMFIPVFMLTKGGPEMATISVAYEIYQNAFMRMMRFDLAAAEGVLLFIATMVISVLYFRLFQDDVSY
ncbi:MAG: ABC transporter permease subunit, partial [Clostridia bacterium]|nr:ABC transporter permease subunit [Clostridia bacterium]